MSLSNRPRSGGSFIMYSVLRIVYFLLTVIPAQSLPPTPIGGGDPVFDLESRAGSARRLFFYLAPCASGRSLFTHTLIYSYTHILIHPYTHTPIYSYTHILIHPYTHTPIYSYTHILIHSYTHTLIYSYTHILIHSYTHILTHTLAPTSAAAGSNSWPRHRNNPAQ